MEMRICPVDGVEFEPRNKCHKFCSGACLAESSKIGKRLLRKIKLHPVVICPSCGARFTSKRSSHKYCKRACYFRSPKFKSLVRKYHQTSQKFKDYQKSRKNKDYQRAYRAGHTYKRPPEHKVYMKAYRRAWYLANRDTEKYKAYHRNYNRSAYAQSSKIKDYQKARANNLRFLKLTIQHQQLKKGLEQHAGNSSEQLRRGRDAGTIPEQVQGAVQWGIK